MIPLLLALAAGPSRPAPKPRLVVVITVDQLRPDYLDRYRPQLKSGLAMLLKQGAVFTEAYHDHAVTETAPGHATILSGRWPAHTGIIRNFAGVQDSTTSLIGVPGIGASPARFRGTELFDWLKAAEPAARALSVSGKDRGAILPIGRAKEQVYWYVGGVFTTSRYYADSLPLWVRVFNGERVPFRAAGTQWTLFLPERDYPEPDSVPYENQGRDFVFPHRLPSDSGQAALAFIATPTMDSLTLAFALEGTRALRLGVRGTTDLLAVSLSTTDAIGHAYGPDSREIHDQVLRLDRYLAWFLKRLTDRVGRDNIVVVLTADHGMTSYPERTRAKTGGAAYRVALDTVITAVNRDLDRVAGAGGPAREWLEFDTGMLLLRDNGRLAGLGIKTDSVIEALTARIVRVQGVARVTKPADLSRADTASDPVARRWIHHLPPDAGVVLTVTLQPGSVWDIPNLLIAMHGQPSEDDAHVPIVFWGRGVRHGSFAGRMNTVDIAPTLGALLGVTPLSLIDGHARTEALGPRN